MRAIFLLGLLLALPAKAMKTSSSFDVSYGLASLSLVTQELGTTIAVPSLTRTISSQSGLEVDYSVALFDYRTVATMSFMQYINSSLGRIPISRFGLGVAYHFIRVNGQRVVMDDGVEGKIWGVSPAVELSLGFNKISINDAGNPSYNFTAAFIDLLPRLVVEIPISASFLLVMKGGYLFSVGSYNDLFDIGYHGFTINAGFRLTTL